MIDFLYKGPVVEAPGQGGSGIDQLIQQNWGKPQYGQGQGPQTHQSGQNLNQILPNQGQKVQPVQPHNQPSSAQNSQGQGGFLL